MRYTRLIVRMLKILAVAAVVVGLVYWIRFSPVPVKVHRVDEGEIVAEVMGTGTLEAHYRATISPRISGRLLEVLVDMGDEVAAEQVLARLDDVELKPQVEMAEASVTVAQATLDTLEADREEARAVDDAATANHERALKLRPGGAISEEEVDRITADWKKAKAGVARAEAAILEGQKQLIAAQRNLAYRTALQADAEIVAPFDGLIVERHRDPGDIAVPGSAVLTLVSTEELWVTAWVDETAMSRIAVGQPARVVFRSEPEHAYRGEVARLGRQADRETREFVVDVRVLELPKNWAVGQRAEVHIETARNLKATYLPTQLVLWRDGTPGVFIRQGQQAVWHDIKLGLEGRERVEVLEGLELTDEVVVPASGKTKSLEGRRISAP